MALETAQIWEKHPLIACHDCDLLYRMHPLQYGQRATCARCGTLLYRKKKNSIDRTLTITLAGLVLFILANVYPFLTFKMKGRVQESILFTGVQELYAQDFLILAVLVLGASIVFPMVRILSMLYVLIPLKFNRRPWKAALAFRAVETLTPWAMMDVYLLGVFVGYVKLIELATLVPGVALYSFMALIVVMAASGAALDPEEVWHKLEAAR